MMTRPLETAPLIVRLLADLLHFPRRRGEADREFIERWLAESELGPRFVEHYSGESRMLDMAAILVDAAGDPDLAEVSEYLRAAAERLRTLLGTESRA